MIAFGSVVYQAAIGFLPDFLDSLMVQSDQDFGVILVNDDIEDRQLNMLLNQYGQLKERIKVLKFNGALSPPELRVQLMEQSKRSGVKLLILGDCDDCFNDDRIKCIKEAYVHDRTQAFFYNDILTFEKNKVFAELPKTVKHVYDIGERNFLGLSNTAVNLELLSYDFINSLKDKTALIFDWYLFSRIVSAGFAGTYVEGAYTYYRIHGNNVAGTMESTYEAVRKEYTIKLQHYLRLSEYNEYFNELYQMYSCIDVKTLVLPRDTRSYWWDIINSEKLEVKNNV